MAIKPIRLCRLIACLLLPGAACMAKKPPSDDLRRRSLSQLEQRLVEIDDELALLARYSIRSGTGGIGYRSKFHTEEHHTEWVEIDFRAEYPLDEIMLVPVIRRDAQTGFQADGFPREFRLIAGTEDDLQGNVIAEFFEEPRFLPRVAPLSIPCHGIKASWIRIETDWLSLRAFDERYVFQLAEIMAFSGPENVALHRLVHSRSNRRDGLAWDERFLVDGFVPYLMDAALGEKSVAFISRFTTNIHPALTIDLGETQAVSRLHLHAVDPSDVLPQALASDFGIPKRMHLDGANHADFSDAQTLLDLRFETIYDMAPVMMWTFPETTNRYFRLNIDAPAEDPPFAPDAPRFGFAEIELFSKGTNMALGKTVTGTDVYENPQRPISCLTDGRNMYGTILPIREWMTQLRQRHDLETERPLVVQELNLRYEQQKDLLQRMGWLSALLAVGIGFTILIDRMLRMRQVRQIEMRIAADLHDELGANLHTIGLLSDLAEGAKVDPEELGMLHQRIRAVTERSGIAVRNCTDMFGANDLHKGLVADMERAAQRIMAKLDHELTIKGEEHIGRLKRRTCFDLFLFYKECLVNISRHSGATQFSTRLEITPREINLTIRDNGRGLSSTSGTGIPGSLRRRAKLLGAKITVDSPSGGGTRINLNLKPRKRLLRFINKELP
ncbi:sensor histidine kinase [Pontiella sp.]|uniref:sensor histidine kinase n=1 Tax=Pontiella sp. TaxID=2837462 RepID=UPI0035638B7A